MQYLSKSVLIPKTLLALTKLTRHPSINLLTHVSAANVLHSRQKNIVRTQEFLPFTVTNLWDNEGARRKAKRICRGPGSGRGKTGGRGHRGQKARAGGGVVPRFEGGQTPLYERLPKWGMPRKNRQRFEYLNIDKILYLIKHGRLDPTKKITIRDLYLSGALTKVRYGVKILGKGAQEIKYPLHLEVSDASQTAIDAIKKAGGSVTCIYRTKLKVKEHVKPHFFPIKLAEPLPTPHAVEKLENIKKRGAEVIYTIPEWTKNIKEEATEAEKSLGEFNIPFPRHEGVGKDKIRKRKEQIAKKIEIKIQGFLHI